VHSTLKTLDVLAVKNALKLCVYTWGTQSAVFCRRHTLTDSLVEKDELLWACFSVRNGRNNRERLKRSFHKHMCVVWCYTIRNICIDSTGIWYISAWVKQNQFYCKRQYSSHFLRYEPNNGLHIRPKYVAHLKLKCKNKSHMCSQQTTSSNLCVSIPRSDL